MQAIREEGEISPKKTSAQRLAEANISAAKTPSHYYRSPSLHALKFDNGVKEFPSDNRGGSAPSRDRSTAGEDSPAPSQIRNSFALAASALNWLADDLRPEISGTGIGETRTSRVSSGLALIGSALGGVHGATFMFDPTEHQTDDELSQLSNKRASMRVDSPSQHISFKRKSPSPKREESLSQAATRVANR
ncbi:MAG: hypothetical protein SGPRY_004135 [Prymnesium sp.]